MNTPNLFSQTNIHTNGMPEVPAQFPGGIQAMYNFMKQHLSYPLSAMEEGIEGTVMVRFLVTEGGVVKSAEILKPLHAECEWEALRLVASMPLWTPAKNAGTNVPVQVELPVHFKLAYIPSEYE